MVTMASLARGSSVFLSTDLSSSGYLVSRWWGLASMSLSFSLWHCWCFSAHYGKGVELSSNLVPSGPAYPAVPPEVLHPRTPGPHRDIRAEQLVVTQQAAHVLHAALFLHTVSDVWLEE